MELTKEQKQVISHSSGHAIVSAVAGSGKTQTMVLRVKHLIETGVNPKDILVVMYNKSAQVDFVKRLAGVIDDIADCIEVKTFHSLGFALSRLLMSWGKMPDFKLMTQGWQSRKLIQDTLEILKKEQVLTDDVDAELIDQYENYLTLIKSDISANMAEKIRAVSFNVKVSSDLEALFERFFICYEKLRISKKLRSFDDLIYEPIKLLSEDKALAAKLPWKYQYIIIDEYQDINAVQQYLIKLFIKENSQVMVVGDVDQTIYEWRGSKPYYMLQGFEKEFKRVTQYQLSNTFRYGHQLSLAANYVITQNKKRLKNLCISHKVTPSTEIEVTFDHSINQLPLLIAKWLKSSPKSSLKDIAVLVRKYSSCALFELACLKHKLPYQIIGNEGVTHAQVTLSLIGYLGLAEKALFFDNLNTEDKRTYIKAMLACPSLYLRQDLLDTAVNQIVINPSLGAQVLLRLSANYTLKPFQAEKVRFRAYIWQELVSGSKNTLASKQLSKIVNTLSYEDYFKSKQYALSQAYDNICLCEALIQYAASVKLVISEFLAHFESLKAKASSEHLDHDGISVLSIHRAKGLEWSKVILLDATEKAFFGSGETHLQEESERRLFYVAMTRAKQKLLIIGGNDQLKLSQWYKAKRRGFPYDLKPSHSVRFLYEMNYDEVCKKAYQLESTLKPSDQNFLSKISFSTDKIFKDYIASLKLRDCN